MRPQMAVGSGQFAESDADSQFFSTAREKIEGYRRRRRIRSVALRTPDSASPRALLVLLFAAAERWRRARGRRA